MAQVTETCRGCGEASTFTIPDDHDGTRIVWECPFDGPNGGCGTRNVIDGDDPADIAIAAAAVNEPDVINVTEGEVGNLKDLHV